MSKYTRPTKEVLLVGGPDDGRTLHLLVPTTTLYTRTKKATGLGHKYADAGDEMTFEYAGEVKEGK